MNNSIKLEYDNTAIDIEAFDDAGLPCMDVTVACHKCYKYSGVIYEELGNHEKWAEAIATRISDESNYDKDTKQELKDALEVAFLNSSKAMLMMIGTAIIEEDYFSELT